MVVTGLGNTVAGHLGQYPAWPQWCGHHRPVLTFSLRHAVQLFGQGFLFVAYLAPKDAKRMDPFIQFGMVAGIQAMEDAGLEITEQNCGQVGCAMDPGSAVSDPDRKE